VQKENLGAMRAHVRKHGVKLLDHVARTELAVDLVKGEVGELRRIDPAGPIDEVALTASRPERREPDFRGDRRRPSGERAASIEFARCDGRNDLFERVLHQVLVIAVTAAEDAAERAVHGGI
jgi:hypothetical protein